jgi:hypothetical protein
MWMKKNVLRTNGANGICRLFEFRLTWRSWGVKGVRVGPRQLFEIIYIVFRKGLYFGAIMAFLGAKTAI